MIHLKIKRKDKVVVVSGRDKGRVGEVLKVFPRDGRLIIGKVNIVTKHKKPQREERGGLQKVEAPVDYSNVLLVCPKCDKGTRARLTRLPTGERMRTCRKCGETIL